MIGVDASQAQIPPEQVPPHSLMFQLKKHPLVDDGVRVGVLVKVGVNDGVGVGVIPQGPSDKISTSGSAIGEIHEQTA